MVMVHTASIASLLYSRAAQRHARRATVLDDLASFEAMDDAARAERSADLEDTALAAVICASLGIEAVVNELYLESRLWHAGQCFPGMPADVSRALYDAWKHGVETHNLVTKCQIATAIAGKARVDFGAGAAQQLGRLIELRNELVHHKPKLVEHGKARHESDDLLERQLSTSFPLANIWTGRRVAFRWSGCLGAGCARWAVSTMTDFKHDFFGHLGVGYPQW